ncbi:DUF1223 domain-containing protein [Flavobacterium sp. JLP]|uniref:DUF1223 domain-containing protein n=1 Tax=Flavobacterium sp. JLP TaxID=2783793 RepID=UPI00188B4E03|nr:DUF1223 domain-containing protein [Flavobacterium sp. JLP]MBF4505357.1 DUF1223 domain-containing protein [Flavobacterium sp. JLP]
MKNSILILFASALSALFCLDCFMFPESEISGKFKTKKTKLQITESNNFAVVELFTSEGCSSCPPADNLMAKLQTETKDKNIYLIAYHVDYWDRLGWKDQFSSNEFTKRQEKYQDWLNLQVMYTPQFIINGTSEFAGYDEKALYAKVSEALKTNETGNLILNSNTVKDSMQIDFKANEIMNSSLFVAVIQKDATSKVKRGENKGSTLHHVQIVRQLKSFPLTKTEGRITMLKPSDLNNFEIIGFIQNNATGKILAISKINLK